MTKNKRVNVLVLAKLQAVLLALLGLIAGIVYSFGGLIYDAIVSLGWATSTSTPGLSYGTILAFGALIGMPLIFAFFGFMSGLVEAVLYNYFSRWFSRLNLDIEQKM